MFDLLLCISFCVSFFQLNKMETSLFFQLDVYLMDLVCCVKWKKWNFEWVHFNLFVLHWENIDIGYKNVFMYFF